MRNGLRPADVGTVAAVFRFGRTCCHVDGGVASGTCGPTNRGGSYDGAPKDGVRYDGGASAAGISYVGGGSSGAGSGAADHSAEADGVSYVGRTADCSDPPYPLLYEAPGDCGTGRSPYGAGPIE